MDGLEALHRLKDYRGQYMIGGIMLKKICSFVVLSAFVFFMSGCAAIIGTALTAAASYGIYKAGKK
jgi:hypothetical protein